MGTIRPKRGINIGGPRTPVAALDFYNLPRQGAGHKLPRSGTVTPVYQGLREIARMSALDQRYRKTERIAVQGRACVGKTGLAEKIAKKAGVPLILTDDFIGQVEYIDAPLYIIDHLNEFKGGYVVCGVHVARMLRKGLRMKIWQPDTVIRVENPYSEIQRKHASIAGTNRRAMTDWMNERPKGDNIRVLSHTNNNRISNQELRTRNLDEAVRVWTKKTRRQSRNR